MLKLLVIGTLSFLLISCSGSGSVTKVENTSTDNLTSSSTFTITSEAIVDGKLLDNFKCEKKLNDIENSIPLSFSNIPSDTKSLAVVMYHYPNTQDSQSIPNSYLLLWGIDPSITNIPYGSADDGTWYMGSNKDQTAISYTSPCSPSDGTHEYTIKVYALSETPPTLPSQSDISVTYSVLMDAINSVKTIETSELTFQDVTVSSSDSTTDSNNSTTDTDSANTSVVASSRCETIQNSVDEFGDVSVTCDENYAYIKSNTFPDHDKMNGITGTNEQIPVPAKDYTSPIKLNPSGTTGKTTIDASLGVAVNGVPIYDYSSQGELDMDNYSYNTSIDTLLLGQLDNCGGHAGRGDDYHYHARPTCMIDAISNKTDETIIGWMYDGYPLYDIKNPDSSSIALSDLDICNGQIDSTFGYRYHTSILAPYVPVCLRGSIDTNNLPRVAPMQGRTSGTPPQGGVSALSYTVNNGVTRMEYSYNGDTYYLQYSASNTADCYIFETKTVTDNGVVKTGEFCR